MKNTNGFIHLKTHLWLKVTFLIIYYNKKISGYTDPIPCQGVWSEEPQGAVFFSKKSCVCVFHVYNCYIFVPDFFSLLFYYFIKSVRVSLCVCVCARACVRARARGCVCVCAFARVYVWDSVCVFKYDYSRSESRVGVGMCTCTLFRF